MKKKSMIVEMNFSSVILSLLITTFFTISVSSSSVTTTQISYSDHCSSIVPESTPTVPELTAVQYLRETTSYFTGGGQLLGNNKNRSSLFSSDYLRFRATRNSYKTNELGVYKIETLAVFRSSGGHYISDTSTSSESTYGSTYSNRTRNRRTGPLTFRLSGFWSEFSGKLCMVGSALWYSSRQGTTLNLEAVLKLNYAKNLTIFNSLFNGTLESLSSSSSDDDVDSNYFEPISILGFSSSSIYNYTLVSEELGSGCSGGIDYPPKLSLSLDQGSVCSTLSSRYDTFELEYKRECNSTKKNCTPFGSNIEYLPLVMSVNPIGCSEEEQKQRYTIDISNSSYLGYYGRQFNPNTTLVGEGWWDGKKNRLCISACRILDVTDSWGNARVGDCSIRLSLMFPAIWSIRNTSTTVGEIWTNKSENDLGYFERITFRSSSDRMVNVADLKYEYTETNRVRKSCPMKKPRKNKGVDYPSGYSSDMRFDMSITDSKGQFGWGFAVPISMDHQVFEVFTMAFASSWTPAIENEGSYAVAQSPIAEAKTVHSGPMNISYKISFNPPAGVKSNMSTSRSGQVEISAEGIYDPDTGHLCMVGCRKMSSLILISKIDDLDCEILVNIQFQPINSKTGGVIEGSIESMRKRSDSLYFEHFNISSNAYYATEAKQSIWRMDLEIIMVLISNTLACVFVALQILYVKKNPNVLPFNSIVMLVILTLGHMVPLVLNFEALFLGNRNRQDVMLGSGGWLEVIVRVVTMVAFLLQIRLLQVAWPSRLTDGSQKGLWAAEMKAMFVSFPSYTIGGIIALFVNMKKNSYGVGYRQHPLWEVFRSYAGLILDGFLFPQILLNVFQSSREKALSHSLYIGTTLVRVLPHTYDLYRTHNYVPQHFNGSYIYANPTADFYSTAWDVIIPIGGIVFAVIIFLQQRYGGRVIVPRIFRELKGYEKVPVVGS